MNPCYLTKRSETFAGWSWEEYRDYLKWNKLTDEEARPRELQARADTDAQIANIVKQARARKKAALEANPKSKTALLANKSANRTEERTLENSIPRNRIIHIPRLIGRQLK